MEMMRGMNVMNMDDVMNECEYEMVIVQWMSMKVNWLWWDECNGYKQCLTCVDMSKYSAG